MRLSFFRSFKFQAEVAKAPRLFHLSVGLRGPLSSESGMSVNLVEMDLWIEQAMCLAKAGLAHSEAAVLESIALCLEEQLSFHKSLQIERIEIQDLVSLKTWIRSSDGRVEESLRQWVVRDGLVYQLEQRWGSYALREPVSGDAIFEEGHFLKP